MTIHTKCDVGGLESQDINIIPIPEFLIPDKAADDIRRRVADKAEGTMVRDEPYPEPQTGEFSFHPEFLDVAKTREALKYLWKLAQRKPYVSFSRGHYKLAFCYDDESEDLIFSMEIDGEFDAFCVITGSSIDDEDSPLPLNTFSLTVNDAYTNNKEALDAWPDQVKRQLTDPQILCGNLRDILLTGLLARVRKIMEDDKIFDKKQKILDEWRAVFGEKMHVSFAEMLDKDPMSKEHDPKYYRFMDVGNLDIDSVADPEHFPKDSGWAVAVTIEGAGLCINLNNGSQLSLVEIDDLGLRSLNKGSQAARSQGELQKRIHDRLHEFGFRDRTAIDHVDKALEAVSKKVMPILSYLQNDGGCVEIVGDNIFIFGCPFRTGGARTYVPAICIPVNATTMQRPMAAPRYFYKSVSQGAWRSCPSITKRGEEDYHFSKGNNISYTLETRVVPELESVLDDLSLNNEVRTLKTADARPIQEAMLLEGSVWGEYGKDRKNGYTYPEEVSEHPLSLAGAFKPFSTAFDDWVSNNIPPSFAELDFPEGFTELEPDFQNPIAVRKGSHEKAGDYTAEIFKSTFNYEGHTYELLWEFSYDKDGKVWISNIYDPNASVTTYGTRGLVLRAGVLTSKLYEYKKMLKPREILHDEDPHYREIGYDLIDKLPLVQRFRAARGVFLNGIDFLKDTAKYGE